MIVNVSTTNDIRKILGSPSTRSKFDNDVWIYIERKQTQSNIKNLGKMKIYKNDILVLEIDNYGILKKKEFYNIAKLIAKNSKILDVGCGNGELMKYITENIFRLLMNWVENSI
mgnify:CR=1 FL=1